ncbi:hypothetical protein EDD70_1047 [Hydrogenoanaerobacterium saccharovorans]|uniref:Uncharacterized protein n=1 Tax=Hydrogenoanaerobacterium saccharovorans TaxID=474960 RepID=A0A1H8A3A6_9FIRM|nr:hypothetical protein [Hydrogenoanaerobacterium saccharovorans]RPF48232.1 hypothetical protein EDD70_1047 [Hydrogenoanaerobacterium saccharovorans]SEM64394.1 hypothetical protein SAMN05216180_1044 [Hydrogenoanaerobacterium saccharovorans]
MTKEDKPILQTTAKTRRAGKPYVAEKFKRELCRAVQKLSLPECKSLPNEVQMLIKLPNTTIRETLVRTNRGWMTEKDAME